MSSVIGTVVPRKDGREKVCGTATYVDDLHFPDLLYGATVWSAVPRGRLINIHYGSGIPWEEFTIVRAADIPGKNFFYLMTARAALSALRSAI